MTDKKWDNHKYVARVSLRSSGKNKKYRYFYTKAEYQAYLKDEKTTKKDESSHFKNGKVENVKVKRTISKQVNPTTAKTDASKVKANINKAKYSVSTVLNKKTSSKNENKVKDVFRKTATDISKNVVDKGKQAVSNFINKIHKNKEKEVYTDNTHNKTVEQKDPRIVKEDSKPERPRTFDELALKITEYSKDEDVAAINPNYTNYNNGYWENCAYCTAAYELRQRGYNVEAAPTTADTHNNTDEILTWYDGAEYVDSTTLLLKNGHIFKAAMTVVNGMETKDTALMTEVMRDELLKQGEGARGHLACYWKDGGGHSSVYEIESGEVVIRDCQTNKTVNFEDYAYLCDSMGYIRTDNVEVTDEILKAVKNKKVYT